MNFKSLFTFIAISLLIPVTAFSQLPENMGAQINYARTTLLTDGSITELTQPHLDEKDDSIIESGNGFTISFSYTFKRFDPFSISTELKYSLFSIVDKRCDNPAWYDDCSTYVPPPYPYTGKIKLHYITLPLKTSYKLPTLSNSLDPKLFLGLQSNLLINGNNPVIFPDLVNLTDKIDPDQSPIGNPQRYESYSRSHLSDSLSTFSAGFTIGTNVQVLTIQNIEIGLDASYTRDFTNNYQGPADIRIRKQSFRMGINVSF